MNKQHLCVLGAALLGLLLSIITPRLEQYFPTEGQTAQQTATPIPTPSPQYRGIKK
jgi:hypothetical protein